VSAGRLAQRRRPRRELAALEDAPRDVGVFDGGDEAHRGSAAGAAKRVDLEDALEQGGPAHPARTLADAGTAGFAIEPLSLRGRRPWRLGLVIVAPAWPMLSLGDFAAIDSW